jgi:hypothetical protein
MSDQSELEKRWRESERQLDDSDDLLGLVGYDVLEVGVRQASPFITFAAPTPDREERRLFIAPGFSMSDAAGKPIEGPVLVRLEPLMGRILVEVRLSEGVGTLQFDNGAVIEVSTVPAPAPTDPPPWRGLPK